MASLAPPLPRSRALPASTACWAATLLIAAGAVAQQVRIGLDCDVSWLLTVAEKWLAGARLYRDVQEVNPPASMLLYLPGVALARAIGARPEGVVAALTVMLAVAGVGWSGRLAVGAGLLPRGTAVRLAPVAAFLFLLLPAGCFAQREHLAALASLPALVALAALAERRAVGARAYLLAGCGAGLAICVKPHFALAFLPAAAVALRRGGWSREVAAGLAGGGGMVAAYALLVVACFPDFFALLPMLATTYLPVHETPARLMEGSVVALPLAIGALALFVARRPATLPGFLLLAATGFAAAGVIQGKGYLNHAYPAAALGFLALAMLLVEPGARAERRRIATIAALALALLEWRAYSSISNRPELADAVARIAPRHARVVALSTELGLGHPLTRLIGGEWVGRRAALFVAGGAERLMAVAAPEERAALAAYAREDARMFAEDVARGRPDLLLDDGTLGPDWLVRHPEAARAMAAYQPSLHVGEVTVWTPRAGARAR